MMMPACAAAILALAASLAPCGGERVEPSYKDEREEAFTMKRPSMKPTAKPAAAPRAGPNLESLLTPGAQVPPEILAKALEARANGEPFMLGGSSQISSTVAWLRDGVCADKSCVEEVEKRWRALLVTGGLGMMGSMAINDHAGKARVRRRMRARASLID